DRDDAQYCSEYAPEIQAYWRSVEGRRAPSSTYMSRQTDVNSKMREILVDWMVEVQVKFKLKSEVSCGRTVQRMNRNQSVLQALCSSDVMCSVRNVCRCCTWPSTSWIASSSAVS